VKHFSRIVRPAFVISAFCVSIRLAQADPIAPRWPQPAGPGTDVWITYSYSNLLDGTFLLLTPAELRAATEEALGLWARYAPLHFVELPDSGPPPSDQPYAAIGTPQIRVGHHSIPHVAHGFFPADSDGLGGDVHIDGELPWTLGDGHWNLLEAITHELGHSLGLEHYADGMAIMNPSYPQRRFGRLGSAFLLAADIAAVQELYGSGRGSVQALQPVPEPAALVLVGTGLAALARIRRRRRRAKGERR
jgi:hypothetical protein